jgi:hypothetical protein
MKNAIEGHPSMFRLLAVSAEKFAIAQSLIKHNDGNPVFQNTQLHAAAQAVTGKKYCPYWIGKNIALKVKGSAGTYDLSRLKLSTAVEAPAKPKKAKKAKPAPKPKRESKAKKGQEVTETAPVEMPTVTE